MKPMIFDPAVNLEDDPMCAPWSEIYPPDFDHGGTPLLGNNPEIWADMFSESVFFNANCNNSGDVVLVVAMVEQGFVEVRGQVVKQGQALDSRITSIIDSGRIRIPVSRQASALIGLDIELQAPRYQLDWRTAARRMELDILSTISRLATSVSS